IHDLARAIAVRQMPAISAKQAGRDGETRCQQTSRFYIQPVNINQIFGQPQDKRDKSTENKEIIERKPPDLLIFQRLQLLQGRARSFTALPAGLYARVILGR